MEDHLLDMPLGSASFWDGSDGVLRVTRSQDPEGPYWEIEVLDAVGETTHTLSCDLEETIAHLNPSLVGST